MNSTSADAANTHAVSPLLISITVPPCGLFIRDVLEYPGCYAAPVRTPTYRWIYGQTVSPRACGDVTRVLRHDERTITLGER
jgi:hypothetical protein